MEFYPLKQCGKQKKQHQQKKESEFSISFYIVIILGWLLYLVIALQIGPSNYSAIIRKPLTIIYYQVVNIFVKNLLSLLTTFPYFILLEHRAFVVAQIVSLSVNSYKYFFNSLNASVALT